jgi:hypothetical protein
VAEPDHGGLLEVLTPVGVEQRQLLAPEPDRDPRSDPHVAVGRRRAHLQQQDGRVGSQNGPEDADGDAANGGRGAGQPGCHQTGLDRWHQGHQGVKVSADLLAAHDHLDLGQVGTERAQAGHRAHGDPAVVRAVNR